MTSRLRICEISHFFCYTAYRQKAVAMAQLTGEKELLITPANWMEDYHGGQTERGSSNEYILCERRAYLNWRMWGGKRFQLFVLSPRIIGDIRAYGPDIIVVDAEPFSLLSFEVAFIRRWFLPNTCLVVHSSQNLYKHYPFPFSATEAFVMCQATALFARSEVIKQVLLLKKCSRPIYVVPHGVDSAHFSPGAKDLSAEEPVEKPLRIGYVGSLIEQKGLTILLEAVSGMNRKFELTICGDGPQRATLETQAGCSPVATRIRFCSSVPNRQLPEVLRQFDVLVLPSVTMPNGKEQFGRIIIEAMACGVPVLGSTCGSIPEVIGDGGMVFQEGDAAQLQACLEKLASDRSLLCRLGHQARNRVLKHYAWDRVVEQIYAIYQRCCEGSTE